MVNSCSAFGCKNRNSKGSQLTFHRFPLNNSNLLKLWLYQIKRGNWEPSKYSVICSEHFTPDSFVTKGPQNNRRTLKNDAIPTKFGIASFTEAPRNKKGPKEKAPEDVMMKEETRENESDNDKEDSVAKSD